MKNGDSEENKYSNDSVKTPGGISKSFLTPCRRLGLSRKWKSGSSPFISPLSQNPDNENKTPETSLNKRKPTKRPPDTENTELKKRENFDSDAKDNEDIISTPIRRSSFSRRKKCKLTSSASDTDENYKELNYNSPQIIKERELVNDSLNDKTNEVNSDFKDNIDNSLNCFQESDNKVELPCNSVATDQSAKSTLTMSTSIGKECMVVIQKQFIDNDKLCNDPNNVGNHAKNDDDIPLSRIKKINKVNSTNELDDCNDFCDENPNLVLNVRNLKDKKTSTSDLNQNERKNRKKKMKALVDAVSEDRLSTQKLNSIDDDDDDDFDFDSKKTILLKKIYNKTKLSRAKSTGSITQKDIDELKARIEAKQRLLIAKTNSKEFEELRALIKKWQKGCQEALAELLDLMKKKIPENQSMSHSELLKTLNIPPSLAGYDEENDCFVSPNAVDFIFV